MSDRRVVVTGLGVVSAIGNDRESFWRSLRSGTSGIAPMEPERPALGFRQVAAVKGFDPDALFSSRLHRSLDRNVQFALAAAGEAIADSGLVLDERRQHRAGVITGCSIGGAVTQDESYERLYAQGKPRAHPMTVPNIMPNAGASHISMQHGFRGPAFTISSACASSGHAIGIALSLIRAGTMDIAVVGGHEAQLNYGSLCAWDALRVVSPSTCLPFSTNPPGMILGEGAAMLVIESMESARARGARMYAELAGFGMTADAGHLTAPSLEGPVAAMEAALADADLSPFDVGYINAHGTGTAANDANELRAIGKIFGGQGNPPAISSTKCLHGHIIGAAGAMEAAVTVLAIQHQVLPSTSGTASISPAFDQGRTVDEAVPTEIRAALSNSFAFGGLNAVLAFRRIGMGDGPAFL